MWRCCQQPDDIMDLGEISRGYERGLSRQHDSLCAMATHHSSQLPTCGQEPCLEKDAITSAKLQALWGSTK